MNLEILKTIRVAKGLSQDEVAKAAGISQAYLSFIERNLQDPQTGDLKRICNTLDLDLVIILKI